ncbi:MAG: 50S ribosomal protein L29 [Chitinophagales bacterium]
MGANKKINQEDVRQFVGADLDAKILADQAELKKLKFQHTVSAIENPASITAKRKNVARLLTEQTRRKKENKG